MASYNGNIDLLSLNGAQVFKGIDPENPERVYVCIPAGLNEIKVEQAPNLLFTADISGSSLLIL